jgi:hypothetical protein
LRAVAALRHACDATASRRVTRLATTHSSSGQIGQYLRLLVSHLFELDQRALKILRMQEEDRLAMGTDLWIAVAEHASARLL